MGGVTAVCNDIQDITATVKRDHEAANKDNNFIYNDLVPDFGTLEPPGKATLAKPVQLTTPAANFVDLFTSLVPLAVNEALQVRPPCTCDCD